MADRYQFNGWSDDLSEDSGSSAWNTPQLSYRNLRAMCLGNITAVAATDYKCVDRLS